MGGSQALTKHGRNPDDQASVRAFRSAFTLSPKTALGLFYIQRYRFMTTDQFAHAGGLNRRGFTELTFGPGERHGKPRIGGDHVGASRGLPGL